MGETYMAIGTCACIIFWQHAETQIPRYISQGGGMQATGVFPGNVQRPTGLYPYSAQARKGIQNLQGKG